MELLCGSRESLFLTTESGVAAAETVIVPWQRVNHLGERLDAPNAPSARVGVRYTLVRSYSWAQLQLTLGRQFQDATFRFNVSEIRDGCFLQSRTGFGFFDQILSLKANKKNIFFLKGK